MTLDIGAQLSEAAQSNLFSASSGSLPLRHVVPELRRSQSEGIVHPSAGASTMTNVSLAVKEPQLELLEDSDDDDEVDAFDPTAGLTFKSRPGSVRSSGSGRSSFGIQIEDESHEESKCFAAHVTIQDVLFVNPQKTSGYVLYEIQVISKTTTIKSMKRFSNFVKLRQDLLKAFPQYKGTALVPRLPPKSSLSKFRPSFLDNRRRALAFWLQTVMLHPVLGASSVIKQWLLDNSSD